MPITKCGYVLYVLLTIMFFGAGCATTAVSKKRPAGLTYDRINTERGDIVHIATVDPRINKIVIHQAQNPSLQSVSDLAELNNSLVAINGGFFTKEGNAAGMLKIDGKMISTPHKMRGVMGWDDKANFYFDRLAKSYDGKEIVSEFGTHSWWRTVPNIVGGAPLLIRNNIALDVQSENTLGSFLSERYARTAICLDKNHHVKLIVVDGGDRNTNKLGVVSGMSIKELADFLLKQGCTDGLNLDGGYSSSFVFGTAKKSSYAAPFMAERPVANAILIIAK